MITEKSRKLIDDEAYMKLAVKAAVKGEGWTSPNPMVGAVIVKDGRVIGSGWHRRYGGLHAEREALLNCTEDPKGADMYVTLEPCCHHGKQPPCTDAVIEAGIRSVVIGSMDPNPLVSGKGVEILKKAGIKVAHGILEKECDSINEIFFHFITTGIPYVALKYAMTMDGKIACITGESRWVSGEKARMNVQRLRGRYRGIMAGIGTVLKDDPLLTLRTGNGRSPVRIICDSSLRTPLDSKIVNTADQYETIIATCVTDEKMMKPYIKKGVRILPVKEDVSGKAQRREGKAPVFKNCGSEKKLIDIGLLMEELGKLRIDSILVEGGAELNWSVINSGYVNKVYTYIAPKLFGGAEAKSPVGGEGYQHPEDALLLKKKKIRQLGDDILIESEVVRNKG